MLVKVNVPLVNMDGQVMKDNDGQGNAVDATLRMAIVNALLTPVQNEKGVDKVKKFNLAQRIYGDDEVELTIEETGLIKERIGEVYAPVIVGQVWNILEGKDGI